MTQDLYVLIDSYRNKRLSLIKHPTIFDIAGFPSRENVFSNVLAFYFDSRQPHGFDSTILECFIKCLPDTDFIKKQDLAATDVKREALTPKGNRIDLIIETSKFIIGIENKIYHVLNNDLEDYTNCLTEKSSKQQIKVVLSLYPHEETYGYKNITYAQFEKALNAITDIYTFGDNNYAVYLEDFIKNIRNHLIPFNMTKEEIEFLASNDDTIDELVKLKDKECSYLTERRNKVFEIITVMPGWNKSIYDKWQFSLVNQTANIVISCSFEITSIYVEVNLALTKKTDSVQSLKSSIEMPYVRDNIIKEFKPVYQHSNEEISAYLNKLINHEQLN